MKNHAREQEADAFRSTIYCTCKTAGLARKMKVQIKLQEMLEDVASNSPNSILSNRCKYRVADLLKDSRTYSSSAVCEDGDACDCSCCATDGCEVDVHAVDYGFEVERDLNIEDLHNLSIHGSAEACGLADLCANQ